MNEHQVPLEVVALDLASESNQMSATLATGSVSPAPDPRKFVMMHASEADFVDWVVAESRRLEKQNDILRGLLLKAVLELKKSNPVCAEMLTSLTPARPQPPLPTT